MPLILNHEAPRRTRIDLSIGPPGGHAERLASGLAFLFAMMTMAYALGHVSSIHLDGRRTWRTVPLSGLSW
jgi:hypothetical protein